MDEPKEKQPKTPEELAEIAYLDKLRTCEGEVMLVGLPLACIVKVVAYEEIPKAIGPHFQSTPYALTYDCLEKHGQRIVKDAPRTFEGLREYLRTHNIEGLVFWKDGEPRCKIKRSDFGFKWPDKKDAAE